jgi:hypothetical protein
VLEDLRGKSFAKKKKKDFTLAEENSGVLNPFG